ncbi:MucR family transcriptional regulator [Alphaproteobacteria bacterium]|nr:MucR family transcriptional regulator [Alphaproteobacteria bacterium]
MNEKNGLDHILSLTTNIVSAHVSNNVISPSDLPNLIQQVYGTLTNVKSPQVSRNTSLIPAISIKKSVTPDFIICLEDGKKLKMLKRHLRAVYGLSLQEYRARWGLPADYPSVAPNYAKKRSSLAKDIGLGSRNRKKTEIVSPVDVDMVEA